MNAFLSLPTLAAMLALHGCMAPAHAQKRRLVSFTDKVRGVTFQFPSDWKKVSEPDSMFQPLIKQAGLAPVVDVETTAMYKTGDVPMHSAIDVIYAAYPASSQIDCDQFVQKENARAIRQYVSLNGTPFLLVTDSDAGMSQNMTAHAYLIYKRGYCHIFEEDDSGGMMNEDEYNGKLARKDGNKNFGKLADQILHSVRLITVETNASK